MTHTDQNQVQVLHVDDEPDFTDLSKTLLERDDDRFTVETTTSAEKGLSMIRECPPDCVVSDYNMPGMNGIEFLDVVREGYPDLPFILFTGKGSETVASDAISAGVTDYLQKEPGTDQYELLANRIRNAVEQVRMRKQLTLKERVVQEMNDIAVIVQDSIIKYTSPGISEFIGYAEDYPIDKPITEFIAPDYRETVQNRHQARMAGNESDLPNPYELELLTKDGERTPVEINVTRIEYEGQSATLSVIRDITERKHQKKRFQAFIEHSRDIITVLEPDGTYRYQSPSSKRVLGYAPDELLGENAFEYVHPDDREGIIEKFNEAVTNPEMVSTVEYRLKHKNGSWRWLESMGNNQLDNPAIEGFVVNSRDITDRKEKQRELQRQNERLERFASIISHDLRNPLSVAQGRLTLLRDECDSEQLDTIEQAHERMAQLINDVLSLARGGKPNLETDTVGLTAIAERSWQTVATDEATLQIETEQTIRADPSRLQQLFENLFRNAVEHGKNGVTVTVDCRHEEAAFTITDDGPGIPEDERNSVFKIGYSTTENGTGFGLPIVHEIVQEHEWEINVTESEDGGTRFEITGVEIVE